MKAEFTVFEDAPGYWFVPLAVEAAAIAAPAIAETGGGIENKRRASDRKPIFRHGGMVASRPRIQRSGPSRTGRRGRGSV